MKRTNKCLVLHVSVLDCTIAAAFPAASAAEGQEQWDASARGTVRCKACDFPRGNQAIRVQGRPCDC